MELMNVYKQNRGVAKLFTDVIIIDWYDGTTTGVCMLNDSEEWYICNLCYFEPSRDVRIFTLIQVSNEWVETFRSKLADDDTNNDWDEINEAIGKAYKEYNSIAFLMKARDVDDPDYEVVELRNSELQYFEGVQETLSQTRESEKKWLSYFN